ncbi:MAG: hypothetical protein NTY12_00790 [Candidatus Falkowbacteria bacterium]|nr:hypothetical protein [Candidatus Falkowbacteria bacterium]
MSFITNSQDILFLVLAFCALWLTAFIVWLLYYAVMTVKQGYHAVKQIKEKIQAVDEIITMVKEKITFTTSYLSLIVTGVKKMIDLLGTSEEKKNRKKK